MASHSWLLLDHESPRYRLPEDLRARDPLGGRDCGWIEQMLPFVRQFSAQGDTVFDPFAGFGTTLLAARLEDRLASGCEVDAGRIDLIRERLARHELAHGTTLLHGSCDALDDAALPPFALCLTNVPYFGCRWTGAPVGSQLYDSQSYAQHLDGLRNVFHRVRAGLREGGACIAMVQNIRLGERVLPLAFDLARILGSLFTMEEERVLVYPHDGEETGSDMRTDRRHEYALVWSFASNVNASTCKAPPRCSMPCARKDTASPCSAASPAGCTTRKARHPQTRTSASTPTRSAWTPCCNGCACRASR